MSRNLFATKVGKFATIAGLAGILGSCVVPVTSIVMRNVPEERRADTEDAMKIVGILLGSIAASGAAQSLNGYHEEHGELFTPRGIPGRNIEDIRQADREVKN